MWLDVVGLVQGSEQGEEGEAGVVVVSGEVQGG